jgi:hypothetical protein
MSTLFGLFGRAMGALLDLSLGEGLPSGYESPTTRDGR